MKRLGSTVVLAATLAALVAAPAGAYEHLGVQIGSNVLPKHWQTLPINLTIDGGTTPAFQSEIDTAVATWNAVGTAKDPWGTRSVSGVDFAKANFGSAWGDLSGDGRQEVVVDADGSILRDFGLDPADINGFGESGGVIDRGEAVINDMYLLINGSRNDYDRQATEIHELGHTLGLGHSSVGWPIGKDGSLDPPLQAEVPTMHPFSISTTDRQTLEPDDVASLSELYPEPSFTSTTGTITGTVTRCGSGDPVLGANVRAINVDNPAIQLSRITGFDGNTDGSYTINGVPPGDYDVVVEPLSGDDDYLAGLPTFTRIDTDFSQEFLNKPVEDDCAQDSDPEAKASIPVGATGTVPANFKVEGASLALVIDVTGSMGPEIGAIKTGLEAMIQGIAASGASMPKTAIVTFDDGSQLRTVSRDPDRLITVIDGLTTHSTPDCPEGSNRALLTAARQLGSGGRAILVTDADSHPTGPTREAVEQALAAKGARLSVLLSGSCTSPPPSGPAGAAAQARSGLRAAAAAPSVGDPGAGPDEARPVEALGVEDAIRTFSEESLTSGGLFSFQPEIKTGTPAAKQHYSNTLANIGISSVLPAIAAATPAAPQGTTLDVELTGSNTGFRSGSTVTVSDPRIAVVATHVLSPTRIVARLSVTPGTPQDFYDVAVDTDRGDGTIETAEGIGALQVIGPPAGPAILSVSPSTGALGATEDVTISGALTHFDGTSTAGFGPGVTVNRLSVTSPTSAVANVTVSPGTPIGLRDVAVRTGAEIAAESVPGPFLVTAATPAIARLASASPNSGVRGTTVDVELRGAGTSFEDGTSEATVSGTGVQVLSTTVTSPTAAVARLQIAPGAPLGFRDLKVQTGTEEAALLDGFEVSPVPAVPPPNPGGGGSQGGGAPSACSDRSAPAASLSKPRVVRGKLRLRGRASDTGCAGSKVARVEVAISRAAGKKCRFVGANGKLTKARKCSQPLFLKAKGASAWSLNLARKLPKGTYALQARALDAAGNRQARPARRTVRVH